MLARRVTKTLAGQGTDAHEPSRPTPLERLQSALRDPLTNLLTRRWLEERLPVRLQERERDDRAVSALFLDVDHFKAVNDTFGHGTGDAVLREIARLLQSSVRDADACVRYGGDAYDGVNP